MPTSRNYAVSSPESKPQAHVLIVPSESVQEGEFHLVQPTTHDFVLYSSSSRKTLEKIAGLDGGLGIEEMQDVTVARVSHVLSAFDIVLGKLQGRGRVAGTEGDRVDFRMRSDGGPEIAESLVMDAWHRQDPSPALDFEACDEPVTRAATRISRARIRNSGEYSILRSADGSINLSFSANNNDPDRIFVMGGLRSAEEAEHAASVHARLEASGRKLPFDRPYSWSRADYREGRSSLCGRYVLRSGDVDEFRLSSSHTLSSRRYGDVGSASLAAACYDLAQEHFQTAVDRRHARSEDPAAMMDRVRRAAGIFAGWVDAQKEKPLYQALKAIESADPKKSNLGKFARNAVLQFTAVSRSPDRPRSACVFASDLAYECNNLAERASLEGKRSKAKSGEREAADLFG